MPNDSYQLTRREILKGGLALVGAGMASPLQVLAQQAEPRYDVFLRIVDKRGVEPFADLSSLNGRVRHRDGGKELEQVTAEEIRATYQSLAKANIVPDISSADLYLDELVARMSSNPNFLRENLKLISAERKGQLIEMYFNHQRSETQDYHLNLNFAGVEEDRKIKPVNLSHFHLIPHSSYFFLITPNGPANINYEVDVGLGYETTVFAVNSGEGQLKAASLLPLDLKDEYLIGNMDVFGRRAKVLKVLQAQDLPSEAILARTR